MDSDPRPPFDAAYAQAQRDADFRLLMENSCDIICRIDRESRPVYVSPAIRSVLGWTPEEAVLGGIGFIHPDDQPMVMLLNERLFSGAIEAGEIRYRLMNSAGQPVWVETTAGLLREPDGSPGDLVIVMRDISERKRLEDELRRHALTDGLTGLANRRAFDQALDGEWLNASRSRGLVSLLLIDVDFFKQFNDRFGHTAGDQCLRMLAELVMRSLGTSGSLAARYGGEEMAVLLPGTSAENAAQMAERIRAGAEAMDPADAGVQADRRITVSIGAATALLHDGANACRPIDLVRRADQALYRAKQRGRNQVCAAALECRPQPA